MLILLAPDYTVCSNIALTDIRMKIGQGKRKQNPRNANFSRDNEIL
jgi:hypothetical protein